MPSLRYDQTINCGPPDSDNPLTVINRGPVKVHIRALDPLDPCSDFYVELKIGNRRARTAFCRYYEQELAIKDLLEHLGFEPTVITTKADLDDDFS